MCTFTWDGCGASALGMPSPDEYPFMQLSEITDDIIDAHYYLGDDKIGCMDKAASNYLKSAVLDDESCIYAIDANCDNKGGDVIKVYPQPVTLYATIQFIGDEDINNKEFVIYSIVGEKVYVGKALQNGKLNINTANWTPGIYYAVIKMENKNLTHRFVVE